MVRDRQRANLDSVLASGERSRSPIFAPPLLKHRRHRERRARLRGSDRITAARQRQTRKSLAITLFGGQNEKRPKYQNRLFERRSVRNCRSRLLFAHEQWVKIARLWSSLSSIGAEAIDMNSTQPGRAIGASARRGPRLRVQDDGKGFDEALLPRSAAAGQYGVPGVREKRATLMGTRSRVEQGRRRHRRGASRSAYAKTRERGWLSRAFANE